MHYTIDYSKRTDKDVDAAAIRDIIDYLGEERFQQISAALKDGIRQGVTEDEFHLPLSFAGVQGFPVGAWYRTLKAEVLHG
jgi:hypothetical protein